MSRKTRWIALLGLLAIVLGFPSTISWWTGFRLASRSERMIQDAALATAEKSVLSFLRRAGDWPVDIRELLQCGAGRGGMLHRVVIAEQERPKVLRITHLGAAGPSRRRWSLSWQRAGM
jgi:hypothetical protein